MKTILSLVLSLFLITSITSCGPTAAEKAAAEKTKEDSIRTATAAEATMKAERKHEMEADLEKSRSAKINWDNELMLAKADLAAANTKMESVTQFHLLRSSDEKAADVRNQTLVIENCEKRVKTAEENAGKLTSHIASLESTLQANN